MDVKERCLGRVRSSGAQTVRALQTHVGAGQGGDWGPDTTRHRQSALNAREF